MMTYISYTNILSRIVNNLYKYFDTGYQSSWIYFQNYVKHDTLHILAKNEINHLKCFITMILFPPNSPTYVVFVNTRSSWTSDVVIFKRYCRQGTLQSGTLR